MPIRIVFCLALLVGCSWGFAQEMNPAKAGRMVRPSLKNGVYLAYEQARSNEPGLVLGDLFKSYYDSVFTIYQWAHTPKLYYIDKRGEKKSLARDSIWGFGEDGNVYLCINQYFHKVSLFGSIIIFREYFPVVRDPLSIVITDKKGEVRDRIYDFETGRAADFDVDNIASLLMRDEKLYKQFDAITTLKEKRKQLYLFVERYNELNPVFPVNQRANQH